MAALGRHVAVLTSLVIPFAALALSPSSGAPAPHPADYSGPEWTLLDAASEQKAAAAMTAARFPDCDTVTVDEKILEIYRRDGTAQTQDETYTKILTDKGQHDNTVMTQGFLLPYFVCDVAVLELIKKDGTVVPIDVKANASVSIDDSQMEENIYDPNSRVLKVNIPGLEVGDVIHSVIRTTTRRPIIADQFADEFLLEGPQFIRHTSCEFRGPETDPLKHLAVRDEVKGTIAHTTRIANGERIDHWEINDVPRMYDEPAMPSYEMVLQRVLVSTLPSWKAVSRWYWNLSAPHLAATDPGMAKTVAELTKGVTSDLDRIRAIFYYVSQNIRYMGVTPEHDRPGFEPHDVCLTFEKKYGVCRDKAGLLVAMLRMAGEKAFPVLINVGSKLDQQVPSPDFNHAIVAVELSPGHYQLMDPTDEHTRVFLPAYDDNQSYLVCRPEGEDLQTSPVEPPQDNMLRIRTAAQLAADGSLTGSAKLSFGGVNDDAYRGAFVEMTPDQRLRFFESRLQQAMPGARVTSLRIFPENLLDTGTPLRAEVGFAATAMAAFGPTEAILTVPWLSNHFGINNYILRSASLAHRKYPMITDATCGTDERLSLHLAPNFAAPISLPAAEARDADCVGYHRSFAMAGQDLTATKELTLNTVEYSPAQYLVLKQTLAQAATDDRKAPVLALSAPPPAAPMATIAAAQARVSPDAELLQDDQELTVQDDHTATLRVSYVKRILTYEGKISESELKLPYNPSTQAVRLLEAYVVSASGKRQEGSPDEINLMDAGWNGSARRYTGGKIFVDSLPGVDIGSTIHVSYEVKFHNCPYLAGFQGFQLVQPIDEKTFRLVAPAGQLVHVRTSGPAEALSASTQNVAGTITRQWSAYQVRPLPQESNLPPAWAFASGVDYYVGDPQRLIAELRRAMLNHRVATPAIQALVRRLTSSAPTRLDALRAIRDFVAKNVRLAGPAFTDLPLSELSDAGTTLSDGYGDLADRAILLDAMLAQAGFEPTLVLASDVPPTPELARIARSFPLLDEFDTPLVRVTVDGRQYYLGDTDQYAPLGATPHDDRLAIDLANGEYETIRSLAPERDRTATVYAVTLDDQGDARIAITRKFYGIDFADANRKFTQMRPEEKALYFQQAVSQVAQGARPVGGLTTDFDRYPGIEQFTVEIDRYGVPDRRFFYFDLPFTPQLLATPTNQRALPLLTKDNTETLTEVRITPPPEFRTVVIAPKDMVLTDPAHAGTAQIREGHDAGEWTLTYRMSREPAIIEPGEYPAALAVESRLENRAAREILLQRQDISQAGP